jgi:hypothetical protein
MKSKYLIFPFLFFALSKVLLVGAALGVGGGSIRWILPIYISVTYVVISISVFVSDNSLSDYNIDSLSLVLLILFETIFRSDPGPSSSFSEALKIVVWIMAGALLIKIIRNAKSMHVNQSNIQWATIGLLSAVVLSVPLAYLAVSSPYFHGERVDPRQYATVAFVWKALLSSGTTAIIEEFIFRGILWGYILKLKQNVMQACIIQAVVFWLFHIDRILFPPLSPVGFWIIVPLGQYLRQN